MLEVSEFVAEYAITRPLSFTLDGGESVALVGPNGSGKTTLLRGITGQRALKAGDIRIAGTAIQDTKAEHRAALVAPDEDGDNVGHSVPEFHERWEWCETVISGLLVDMVRGCCTFHLNGQRGPCVKLPGDLWRRHGIQIAIEGFPYNVSDTPPCVLTCSSFVPGTALRDPRLHEPKTIAEHHASGVLRYYD